MRSTQALSPYPCQIWRFQIAVNSGEDGSIVVGKISENEIYAFDYDAQEGQYGDLVSKGSRSDQIVRTASIPLTCAGGKKRTATPPPPNASAGLLYDNSKPPPPALQFAIVPSPLFATHVYTLRRHR